MRINHNISSMITQGSLFMTGRSNNKTLEKLSTGLRINRASDDAAGLSISENLRTQVNGLAMAKRNGQDGIALLQIAEGAMNEISAILQRMRELAVQSANDTLTTTERLYTDAEYQQLISEIDRISDATTYNGMTLLDGAGFGTGGDDSLWIGANDVAATDSLTIAMTAADAGTLGVSGDVTDQTNAVASITECDTAIDALNAQRSDVGAYVNRLEHAINNIINQEHNTQAAESVIRDTDFAVETANFTKYQILQQSGTAMLAQANMVSQNVLGLLGR